MIKSYKEACNFHELALVSPLKLIILPHLYPPSLSVIDINICIISHRRCWCTCCCCRCRCGCCHRRRRRGGGLCRRCRNGFLMCFGILRPSSFSLFFFSFQLRHNTVLRFPCGVWPGRVLAAAPAGGGKDAATGISSSYMKPSTDGRARLAASEPPLAPTSM